MRNETRNDEAKNNGQRKSERDHEKETEHEYQAAQANEPHAVPGRHDRRPTADDAAAASTLARRAPQPSRLQQPWPNGEGDEIAAADGENRRRPPGDRVRPGQGETETADTKRRFKRTETKR